MRLQKSFHFRVGNEKVVWSKNAPWGQNHYAIKNCRVSTPQLTRNGVFRPWQMPFALRYLRMSTEESSKDHLMAPHVFTYPGA